MWKSVKLGDVCLIQSGNSIAAKKKTELFTNVVGPPYVATKDIGFDGNIDDGRFGQMLFHHKLRPRWSFAAVKHALWIVTLPRNHSG